MRQQGDAAGVAGGATVGLLPGRRPEEGDSGGASHMVDCRSVGRRGHSAESGALRDSRSCSRGPGP